MKILYLHQYFNTPEMVGSLRSYEFARHLVNQGHEVHMITSWREECDSRDWFFSEESGIQVHWLPLAYSNKLSFAKRLKVFFRFAYYAAKKLVELNGDVVFATSTPLTIALPAVIASRSLHIPMVFEVRDLWPEVPISLGVLRNPVAKWLARRLERFAYNRSAHIIALSPDMKVGITESGTHNDRVTVIPNIADLSLFSSLEQSSSFVKDNYPELEGRRVVLYTGTFGYVNGLSYLVKMAKTLKDEGDLDICFVAIGGGAEFEKVKEEAESLGVLNSYIYLYPAISKQKIPSLIAKAELMISLVINNQALWANSANKFFDALASGTPIIINHRGWQADLIDETGAGLVLPADSPELGAVELIQFMTDTNRMLSAGIAAKRLAKERFERNLLVRKFEKVLLDVIKRA